jgi:hypothetical protein
VEILTGEEGTVGVATALDRDEPARILRVFHGRLRTGELDAYIAEVEAGVAADARVNDGLVSFVLGHDGNDRFTSVSTWTGWSAIEAATGGNTRQPFATRHALRLTGFEIAHLELLPEAPVQRPARVDSELELAT